MPLDTKSEVRTKDASETGVYLNYWNSISSVLLVCCWEKKNNYILVLLINSKIVTK